MAVQSEISMGKDEAQLDTQVRGQRKAQAKATASGAGLGAVLMYIFDRERGLRRRRRLQEWAFHRWRLAQSLIQKGGTDIKNRGQGFFAALKPAFQGEAINDRVLVERIRAKMGRYVSHPHAIEVEANDGQVTLHGRILTHEVPGLLTRVVTMRGVHEVINLLEPHRPEEQIPDLQGGKPKGGERSLFFEKNWAPGTRLIAGFSSLFLFGYGIRQIRSEDRRILGQGLVVGSAILGARALFNLGPMGLFTSVFGGVLEKFFSSSIQRDPIRIQKTLNVDAPVETVFQTWCDFERLPAFMKDVKEVKFLNHYVSHWVMRGAFGLPVRWNAVVSRMIPNELIEWKTTADSPSKNCGRIQFYQNEGGGTRVDIEFAYFPTAGILGHGIAKILGVDPKTKLNLNLVQFKNLIETKALTESGGGRKPRKAEKVKLTSKKAA